MITKNIQSMFEDSIKTKQTALESLPEPLTKAVELAVNTLKNGNKILICGNGGSAADAQHFAAELICRFERERESLPAIALTTDTSALTAIANDYAFNNIFARQVSGLGNDKDLLIAISTSGNSENVYKAIEIAHQKNLSVIFLSGKDGGKIAGMLKDNDIEIRVPSSSTARIQEVHILCLHCICDQIDDILFT